MSRDSNIRRAGYDWYPNEPLLYHPNLSPQVMDIVMDGWFEAKADSGREDASECKEYEEMRDWFERWEYLKSKYEGETE